MQAALTDLDRISDLPQDVLAVTIVADRVGIRPEDRLLYYPAAPNRTEAAASRFAEAEQAEFAHSDLNAAAAIYNRLADDDDSEVRAGALTRLARVHRKRKNHDAALRAYDRLSLITHTAVAGLPAGLIAREGRASVFAETLRTPDLRKEASAFLDELRSGRWQLSKSEFEFYSAEAEARLSQADAELDADDVARAEAVGWLWENRNSAGSAVRRLIETGSGPALVVSRTTTDGLMAAVAGPKYLAALCREAVPDPAFRCTLSDSEGRAVVGQTPPDRSAAIRTAAAAKLPWTLQVFEVSGAEAVVSPRRRLLFGVAGVLGIVWLTGAIFIVRAIGREARVAQLQSDFVAAVSHEFRSPLSSLCQISEMLAADRLESQDLRRQAYGVLARESERLRRLVEGLLDFQRFEAGAAVYNFERLEIGALLRSIVAEFQERVASAGYTIDFRAPEAATYLKADREALSRAVWNLIDNAVKYSPECRTVWLDASRTPNGVSVAVQDRGLGIPAGEQREIFEKFVRGADSKTRRIKGTGIGLAMVRHIVEAHGGEIGLSSQPGEGSRFTILLPAEGA
jgi:signal transduction histidine kinase